MTYDFIILFLALQPRSQQSPSNGIIQNGSSPACKPWSHSTQNGRHIPSQDNTNQPLSVHETVHQPIVIRLPPSNNNTPNNHQYRNPAYLTDAGDEPIMYYYGVENRPQSSKTHEDGRDTDVRNTRNDNSNIEVPTDRVTSPCPYHEGQTVF